MHLPVKKIPISAHGFFQARKKENWGNFRVFVTRGLAQMAEFRSTEIISGASEHPKNVRFVHEFCWGECTVLAL